MFLYGAMGANNGPPPIRKKVCMHVEVKLILLVLAKRRPIYITKVKQ